MFPENNLPSTFFIFVAVNVGGGGALAMPPSVQVGIARGVV